jgi:hypothetical protein
MTTTSPRDIAAALAEAHDLLDRLPGSTKRDRAAFLLGYTLAFDAMAALLPPAEQIRHFNRTHALQTICARDFQ